MSPISETQYRTENVKFSKIQQSDQLKWAYFSLGAFKTRLQFKTNTHAQISARFQLSERMRPLRTRTREIIARARLTYNKRAFFSTDNNGTLTIQLPTELFQYNIFFNTTGGGER